MSTDSIERKILEIGDSLVAAAADNTSASWGGDLRELVIDAGRELVEVVRLELAEHNIADAALAGARRALTAPETESPSPVHVALDCALLLRHLATTWTGTAPTPGAMVTAADVLDELAYSLGGGDAVGIERAMGPNVRDLAYVLGTLRGSDAQAAAPAAAPPPMVCGNESGNVPR